MALSMKEKELAITVIKEHEGFEAMPYLCPAGHVTIGYGRNLETGLSMEEARTLFPNGITQAQAQILLVSRLEHYHSYCRGLQGWESLNTTRKVILLDMAYNLGIKGISRFKKMLYAVALKDYAKASREMLDSRWAKQVPNRAHRLAEGMRLGILRGESDVLS